MLSNGMTTTKSNKLKSPLFITHLIKMLVGNKERNSKAKKLCIDYLHHSFFRTNWFAYPYFIFIKQNTQYSKKLRTNECNNLLCFLICFICEVVNIKERKIITFRQVVVLILMWISLQLECTIISIVKISFHFNAWIHYICLTFRSFI